MCFLCVLTIALKYLLVPDIKDCSADYKRRQHIASQAICAFRLFLRHGEKKLNNRDLTRTKQETISKRKTQRKP